MLRIFWRLTLLMTIMVSSEAIAEQHTLQPDFTFKRIGVPSAGSRNRITVQIAPAPAAPIEAAPATTPNVTPSTAELAWFWDSVSPALGDTGPGRLEQAVTALRDAPDGVLRPSPRLETMKQIVAAHGSDIILNSIGTDISPALIVALISVESNGSTTAAFSTASSGCCAPAHPGGICRPATARLPRSTIATTDGPNAASGWQSSRRWHGRSRELCS